MLLEYGANPSHCAGNDCLGPLYQAVSYENMTAFKLLLQSNVKLVDRYSALHQAIIRQHKTMVQLLLEQGRDPHARGRGGQTALHLAAEGGNRVIIDVVLKYIKNLNINIQDDSGISPLHRTVDAFHYFTMNAALIESSKKAVDDQITTIMLFLQKGMLYNIKNKKGHYATDRLPKLYQDLIQNQYQELNDKICQQLGLNGLPKRKQQVVAEQWRRLGELNQILICLLLGLKPPVLTEEKGLFESIVKKLVTYLPASMRKTTEKCPLSTEEATQYHNQYSLYRLCKDFKRLPEGIKYLILQSFPDSFDESIEPFLQISSEYTLSIEGFISILLKCLPTVCKPYSEKSLRSLDEKIQAKIEKDKVDVSADNPFSEVTRSNLRL